MVFSVRRMLTSSMSLWILVTFIGIYFLLHLNKFINFGIDLVGGTYMTLEVQVEKAFEAEVGSIAQKASQLLKKAQKPVPVTQSATNATARMTFANDADALTAEQELVKHSLGCNLSRSGSVITCTLSQDKIADLQRDAVQSNINVLRTRLDKFGVGEISIAAQGDKNIIVELPNVDNPQQAKALIGTSALLELKPVQSIANSKEELLVRFGGKEPEGFIALPGVVHGREQYFLVPSFTEVTGRLLKDAKMAYGGQWGGEPVVSFTFNAEGGEKFYAMTSANLGKPLAIILDNKVINAPIVKSAISSEGQISGDFTPESAQDFALLLKSGAFVAPVTFEEERHIGPSLGAESIRQGLIACGVALLLLFLFCVIVYKIAGLFAFIVLLYNLLLTLFMLAWFGATLSLPGIAGMVLTIGMAIDASILIFERVKEELAKGANFKQAINIGFDGARSVILDANITHFLVALVLYKLGSGPLQGFAVTMIIGIVATLITGLYLLKALFDFTFNVLGLHKVSI